MSKRRFFIKLMLVIFLCFMWYYFIYIPQIDTLAKLETQLMDFNSKVHMAQTAKVNLVNMRNRYQTEQDRLQKEKSKFVRKQDLGKVTKALQELAKKYDLKLVDFSPGFRDYFEKQDEKIIPLPLSVTLVGRYLSIGRFLEEWENLPFYLIPVSIILEKLDKNGYDIQAVIESKLYTWND
ncbi:MAG: type 4a pilus biogenesis protein PilO [Caldisericaceae bacterium]|nr:type 4a pilus biogenesis protein PilO [Caldisericaceae bacterium]